MGYRKIDSMMIRAGAVAFLYAAQRNHFYLFVVERFFIGKFHRSKKTLCWMIFVSVNCFDHPQWYVPCEKDSGSPFLVSLEHGDLSMILQVHAWNSEQERLLGQSSMHLTFYKCTVLRDTRKVLNAIFTSHGYIICGLLEHLTDIK